MGWSYIDTAAQLITEMYSFEQISQLKGQNGVIAIQIRNECCHKNVDLMILEITPFKDLVPFLIPLVVVLIGTTTSAISNSPSAASNLKYN